jgi:hypothetical protein
MSSSHMFFGLPSGRVNIGFHLYTFLPFSLPSFDANGRTSLIFVLLCDLLYFYVLLINLIHRLFDSPCKVSFFCRTKNSS